MPMRPQQLNPFSRTDARFASRNKQLGNSHQAPVQMKQLVVVVVWGTAVFKVNLFASWSARALVANCRRASVQWQKSGMFVGVISSRSVNGGEQTENLRALKIARYATCTARERVGVMLHSS
jgi:hypothetical protein